MKILAIDTSGKSAGLAILDDENVLAEMLLNMEIHHSESLLPAIDHLCRETHIDIRQIDLFACTTGPGSFTGLRIGLSTVKGLALATGKPVTGISTLSALALNASCSPLAICPMLDARKNQIYTALYRQERSGELKVLVPDRLSGLNEFLQLVTEPTLFLGDGAARYRSEIEEACSDRCLFTENFHNQVRGSVVGFLGFRRFKSGVLDDVLKLTPRYLRLSEAEEKQAART
ncbi:MAG: tRNA (adenosine(37)-N6)-threonylcarbamoyltransferase complex dimerization subunit type 1 TsaB [Syntrophales bacterium]|nr:tRNA (adenosine(37)-N6)-threonylcarbamoyltransferase complex dimerization subunit type 1 TsaB [Syntrophales bacterium]